ncbi:sporulation protein [Sporolactobacillus sp. THM7-4]|nr:sporulation protein [Sporolactobacillus sp. THM7-4]
MRIPPYYKMPDWQRFLAGCVIGLLIGFSIFLFLYGTAQEKQINKIREQKAEIEILKEQKKILIESEERKNEDLEKKLTVQEIEIYISDHHMDEATKAELENAVADELHSIVNHSIESVADNRELIEKAIERKPLIVSDITYHFKVKSMVIFSTVTLQLQVSSRKDNTR